jgi:hypothetical protein
MMDLKIGKGVYVWRPASISGGDPEAIAGRFEAAGVSTAVLQICDGFQVLSDLEPLVGTLRNHGIRVGAWGYSYLNRAPIKEAIAVGEACERYEPDFYLINVEKEVEGNHDGARIFMEQLRSAISGLPVGLNTYANVSAHPRFPWAEFLQDVDFACPLVYWRSVDPVGRLITTQQAYADLADVPEIPMPVVAGDLYTSKGVQPTPEQVTQFLNAAHSDPFINGVLMWAADDTQTTPELWQAFSRFQWQDRSRAIPAQPLGWARIKASGGVWIRSSPGGTKLAGLAEAELAPLWAVTDTKWAALTPNADQWIFIGNPDQVDSTLEMSGDRLPPPAGLILYQARVAPRRGLNVREGIGGRVLRALPANTVVRVYESKDGWARINAVRTEWVSAAFLSRITA